MPVLEACADDWHVLPEFRDVLEKLADLACEAPTPEMIHALLLECGVEDIAQPLLRRELTPSSP